MEALFAHLISHDRIPRGILQRCSSPSDPAAPYPGLPFRVLEHFRGTAPDDDDMWNAWRFFARDLGSPVWLTGLIDRPELNGTRASIASFDTGTPRSGARIGVKLEGSADEEELGGGDGDGEKLLLPGRNPS